MDGWVIDYEDTIEDRLQMCRLLAGRTFLPAAGYRLGRCRQGEQTTIFTLSIFTILLPLKRPNCFSRDHTSLCEDRNGSRPFKNNMEEPIVMEGRFG